MNKQDLIQLLEPYGQEHLVQFWDELTDIEKEHLYNDIVNTEIQEIVNYYDKIKKDLNESAKELDALMNPVPAELKGSYEKSTKEQLRAYELEGLKAIANGEVAVLLLAGGQGTRLGVTYPKGMYSVSLLSGKTLYQLQAERLIRLQELAGNEYPEVKGSIPWYIMTSEHTQESTQDFFKKNNYFGLNSKDIVLFEQEMLPCLTKDGKIILDQKHKISKAPDGNGGLYKSLLRKKVLEDMAKRGIKYVHIYGVDNILIRMADPLFIGFCISKQANCAAKVVQKTDPEEKVGVICKVNDRFQVVEYSEISEATRNLREENGELTYNAGSICNHFLTSEFLNDLCRHHEKELKHHVAEKKIPYINENGERINPIKINGIKLEKFVFDVFPFSTAKWATGTFAIWEVPREKEFSPLKNGDDSSKETPTTCRTDLSNQHAKWIENAGGKFITDPRTNDTIKLECEISPLVSYDGEGLDKILNGKILKKPLKLELDKVNNKVTFNDLDYNAYSSQLNLINS